MMRFADPVPYLSSLPVPSLLTPPHPLLRAVPSIDEAVRILTGYEATGEQDAVRRQLLETATISADALERRCMPGHLTGSAFVVDHAGERTLLLLHAKLGRWLQPGGHADGDGNLVHVAWREATEETGIEGLTIWPVPIDVDIHRVGTPGAIQGPRPNRAEGPHDHLDVRFLVIAPPGAAPVGNHESRALRWVDRAELAGVTDEPGLLRLAAAGWDRFDRLPGA